MRRGTGEEYYQCTDCHKIGFDQEFTLIQTNDVDPVTRNYYEELKCPDCGSMDIIQIEQETEEEE